jgi:hypothetical protein
MAETDQQKEFNIVQVATDIGTNVTGVGAQGINYNVLRCDFKQ